MAEPAYRYNYAAEPAYQPRPEQHPAATVRVVPGRRQTHHPSLSDGAVFAVKILVTLLVVLLVVGAARVALTAAAYVTASQASALQAQIEDAQATNESLTVQESLLVSPSNIQTEAEERLSMTAAESSETLTLESDPVAIDSDGNLSFAESVARLS